MSLITDIEDKAKGWVLGTTPTTPGTTPTTDTQTQGSSILDVLTGKKAIQTNNVVDLSTTTIVVLLTVAALIFLAIIIKKR